MWDYEVDECSELGHEYDEGIDLDMTGEPVSVYHCTWCGIVKE